MSHLYERDQGSQPSDDSGTFTKLNPHATEFVPSHKLSSEYDSCVTSEGEFYMMRQAKTQKKTEATSTTTLTRREMISSMNSQSELVYKKQKELFRLLRQLGSTSQPLFDVRVCLAPNGSRINVEFSGPSTEQLVDASNAWACEAAALYMDVHNAIDFAERPSNVLVAQFLTRMSDAINVKIRTSQESIHTKCTKQSYTEEEIERQIEGIKKFEKFLISKEGSQVGEILKHTAYKELCNNLGILRGNKKFSPQEQVHENEFIGKEYIQNNNAADDLRKMNTEQTAVTTSDEEVEEALFNEYEKCDTPEFISSSSLSSAYNKIFKYSSPDGVELHVNQLSDAESQSLLGCNRRKCQHVPNTTPVISKMGINIVSEQARHALAKVAAAAKEKAARHIIDRPSNGSECKCNAHKCARKKHSSNVAGTRSGAKNCSEPVSDIRSKNSSRVATPNSTDLQHMAGKSNAAAGNRSVKLSAYNKLAKLANATQRTNGAKQAVVQKVSPRGIAASFKSEIKRQRLNLLKGHNLGSHYNDYLCK